ncbi:hypothetical protein PoB_005738200 [Plakobranchus ocellatus]|uniref:Uncharacterized protein n=1 Tax=Plakobranchus ocellatus TaxID=259542 RepID=A0AAV4CHG9_9GAST|nr:hypothetical protein PoB_005738200 [Plakobranchus ocellatus]
MKAGSQPDSHVRAGIFRVSFPLCQSFERKLSLDPSVSSQNCDMAVLSLGRQDCAPAPIAFWSIVVMPVHNKVNSGFEALRQANSRVAGLEPATEGVPADLKTDSLGTVQPTPGQVKRTVFDCVQPVHKKQKYLSGVSFPLALAFNTYLTLYRSPRGVNTYLTCYRGLHAVNTYLTLYRRFSRCCSVRLHGLVSIECAHTEMELSTSDA